MVGAGAGAGVDTGGGVEGLLGVSGVDREPLQPAANAIEAMHIHRMLSLLQWLSHESMVVTVFRRPDSAGAGGVRAVGREI